MRTLSLGRYALSVCATAILLAACGWQSPTPASFSAATRTGQAGPAEVPARRPTEAEWERWRSMILRIPDPGHGCLKAIYPERQWRETQCVKVPNHWSLPADGTPTVNGHGTDWLAQPIGLNTTNAKGWFPSFKRVNSEFSANGYSTSGPNPDYYSLQINTNPFVTTVCAYYGSPNPNCEGWEQFVFWNQGNNSGDDGNLHIEYWLLNYGPCGSSTCTDNCPSGWQGVHRGSGKNPMDCTRKSSNSQDVQSETIKDGLKNFRLGGAAAQFGYFDNVTLDVTPGVTSGGLYRVYGDNVFPHLSDHWRQTEFNVLGVYNGAEAFFNSGSTIDVRLAVTTSKGTTAAPTCPAGHFTGESNNLFLTKTSSKWPLQNWPAIIFTESNAANRSKTKNCVVKPAK